MHANDSSPITGWDRARWASLADQMLMAVRPHASENHARIVLPGKGRGFGVAVDGLEGFARTFLLAGFRLAGENGDDPLGLADWYAQGIAAGTAPDAPDTERWVRMSEDMQAKVEAASIAVILDMTRPWIWDRLDAQVQANVINYLSEAVGDETYIKNNWLWFRLIVQTFLRSVGGPFSLEEMRADLAQHDSYAREDGWLSDGAPRAYDHYQGWAMHLYPALWSRMPGAEDLAAERGTIGRGRLARYLTDAVNLVGADATGQQGAPLIQGRSLTYRFACAAPYWLGGLQGVDTVPLGMLRRAASGIVDHFVRHGAPDADGLLNVGWFEEWLPIAQDYSGPSSPYWAVKGMIGLMLPADHPAWTQPEQPLPIESGNVLAAVRAASWIVTGSKGDGIIRVINHGSDNAFEGDRTGDSPLYARLAYSTATFPLLDENAWGNPSDNSIGLVDGKGRVTHRTGFTPLGAQVITDTAGISVGVAASRGSVRWLNRHDDDQFDSGRGWTGDFTEAGHLSMVSLVRGTWEVRLARVDSLTAAAQEAASATPEGLRLSMSGYPTVAGDGLRSTVQAVGPGVDTSTAGLLPSVNYPAVVGQWAAAVVLLERDNQPSAAASPAVVQVDDTAATVAVTWPDGLTTTTALPVA
ncbi:MAG: DUF2264 domain-containing protein [Cellulomonadaceae bacterium]|nr:DUF2264 domain-containing protein [Cellulomonadaceae bacterium]